MKKLQVICEMGQAEKRALLIELPKNLIDGLAIAADGSINTLDFLELLNRHYNLAVQDHDELPSDQLMTMIFGTNANDNLHDRQGTAC